MDTQRIIALVVFVFSGMLLWEAWNKYNHPPAPVQTITQEKSGLPTPSIPSADKSNAAVPSPMVPSAIGSGRPGEPPLPVAARTAGKRISILTDALDLELDPNGGDIRRATLLKHPARGDATKPFTIMQEKQDTYFVVQSGLLGAGLPNHTAIWISESDHYKLDSGDTLTVTLTNADTPGLKVEKIFTLTRGSYVVNIRYSVKNETGVTVSPQAYFQFLRDGNPPEGESTGNIFAGVATFTGPTVYTDEKKFQKVDFSAIDKGKQEHVKEATDGWVAMVQHYFVSAWLPPDKAKREYFTKKVSDRLYTAGVIVSMPTIAPGASESVSMPLYVGPQEQEKLKQLAPGLDLVVDYGWLTVLAYPMFAVLSWINKIVGNWGWTIVIFTFLLKLVFFPLNQKAGKSMAHMKHLAPKVEALKARYGDDKMKMNQAMMELYKTEKINPLGGCLPILIQMPFLIAMYWVLLGAVELRNAPWLGWITDLSTPDPFYVLPVIMGASMLIQTKLNPTPPDPVQAKVMMLMPIVFSVMFFFFPAGLVLYWTMQNILGIGQQWYINKTTAHLGLPKSVPTKK